MKNPNFDSIIGQHTAKVILKNAISSNKIAPVYLFWSNIDGIGKAKTAFAFTAALVEDENITNHPDVLVIKPSYSPEGKTFHTPASIRIEEVRTIIKFTSTTAVAAKRKVVILHEAETLQEKSSNALLKTLEESPNCVFILISSHPDKISATITSRSFVVPFTRLTPDEVAKVLDSLPEYKQVSQEIIALANGSPGVAIKHIKYLQSIPSIVNRLQTPPRSITTAISLSNEISSLEFPTQLWLIEYLQYLWQEKGAKLHLSKQKLLQQVQTRAVWDTALIP